MYSLVNYIAAAFSAVAGIVLIVMRHRLHRFVHGRYEKMLRADGLTDEEIAGRIPGMKMILFLGIGLLIVSSVFIVSGTLALSP